MEHYYKSDAGMKQGKRKKTLPLLVELSADNAPGTCFELKYKQHQQWKRSVLKKLYF